MADYPVTPHTPALSEQEIIRRQKLQSLIDAGQNPYAVISSVISVRERTV